MQSRAHFSRENMRECRLAEAGRAREQDVIEWFSSCTRSPRKDLQIVDQRALPDIVVESRRTQTRFETRVVVDLAHGDETFACHRPLTHETS
jgi:hypothetical protein